MLRHIETDDMTLSLVKFANGARGVVQSTLLYHPNPLTPNNKIEVIGSEASMVLHQEYTQPSLPSVMLGSRENGWQANVKFGSNHDPSLVQRLDALEAEVSDAPVRALPRCTRARSGWSRSLATRPRPCLCAYPTTTPS